jgi:soluble lytic murein transglycosylase-like protein
VLRTSAGLQGWHPLLDTESLLLRARHLLEDSDAEEALTTLSLVPVGERDFEWLLAQAEALTRDRRGVEALELLAEIETTDPGRRGPLEWQRAQAALDASRARRGRTNLPQSRRREMRELALAKLEAISQLAADDALTLRALRLLFGELSDQDDGYDRAFAVLQRLRRLDPSDTSGTGYLWRLGWQAFTRRDHPVAIGYWSELEALYPGTNTARGGRYWTARAHDSLGHVDRARGIYREIIDSGIEDFYSRHARSRLGETGQAADPWPSRPAEPWPEDRLLDRARRLSDLGLDQLALYELEGLRPIADHRAFCAVEALALARQGRRRESIRSLACAFPFLGKPGQSDAPEEALRLYYPLDYRQVIEIRAREQGLSPYLVFAMVRQESAFDASARSWAGARGLMQVMPATGRELARRLGLPYSSSNLNDPDFSVRLGTLYFRQVLEMFDGNQELALAGYNGGPYRIRKLWRQAGGGREIDHFVESLSLEETKIYVKRILLFENSYQRLYAEGG